tara:strand:+ start:560 stop:1066 length:507 start_codon:yes stop_codon:yes gene_type:complete
MKIYFDGCSYTYGGELYDPKETRYSKIIANKLSAIDYNFARIGGSNRRIVRNLIEKDLSQYNIFIIQLTKKVRTEYYDGTDWIGIKYPDRMGMNKFWEEYYRDIYHDKYGTIDKEICYHAIMNLLDGKKYFILDIDQCKKLAENNLAQGGHPNEKGHEIIANYILDNI